MCYRWFFRVTKHRAPPIHPPGCYRMLKLHYTRTETCLQPPHQETPPTPPFRRRLVNTATPSFEPQTRLNREGRSRRRCLPASVSGASRNNKRKLPTSTRTHARTTGRSQLPVKTYQHVPPPPQQPGRPTKVKHFTKTAQTHGQRTT
ncbi:unnamed protein product, partial [Ectocarpus fasciculatus]